MSDDIEYIVVRLRRTRADMIGTDDEDHYFDCHEAAHVIEELRDALVAIRDHPEEDGVADSMEAIARTALEDHYE